MKKIAIYLEGGGDTAQQKADLRTGMDALLEPQKQAARTKSLGWKMIPCGGRQQTFGAFKQAISDADDETLLVLLVDSEGPLPPETKNAGENVRIRAEHLRQRDDWDFSRVDPQQVHLMVQCMEAWIVSDPETLSAYYGQNFHRRALPSRHNLEEESTAELLDKLKKATRKTQKGEYAKIKHASKLLEKLTREKVAKRCSRFATFTAWLSAKIGT